MRSWLTRLLKTPGADALIARRQYGRAVSVLKDQVESRKDDLGLRLKLAEVLLMEGREGEAVPHFLRLADEFAREGFAAKAISLLKRVERLAPGRADVEGKLADLIKQPLPEARSSTSGSLRVPQIAPPEASGAEAHPVFEEELLDAIEAALQEAEAGPPAAAAAPGRSVHEAAEASLLFRDFSREELAAVIRGMRLLAFEPGDIVITEGEPGESLFVLTTGVAKAFVRAPDGRNLIAREMTEGDFFGEISILQGGPRTATVTTKTRCELLELSRPTVEDICRTHPRVRQVLQMFCEGRVAADKVLGLRRDAAARTGPAAS
jgi:hypothetical protein